MVNQTETQSCVAPYDSNVYNTVNHALGVAVQKAEARNIHPLIDTVIPRLLHKAQHREAVQRLPHPSTLRLIR